MYNREAIVRTLTKNLKYGGWLVCCFLQDTFFYSLVYDPTQKTLLADKGEIRVGPRFQADVPEMLQEGQSELHLNWLIQLLIYIITLTGFFISSLIIHTVCGLNGLQRENLEVLFW